MAAAQAPSMPPRDVRVREAGAGTITGIVVADDPDARPVRHARVTLGSSEPAIGLTTISGDDGQFRFERLPAGRFSISVVKAGWLPIAYGAKRPQGPGTPVPLGTGEAARVVIRLPRGGVVTGAVFDSGGQPAVGATVTGPGTTRRSMASGGSTRRVRWRSPTIAASTGSMVWRQETT